ncbi:hypothetical protein Acr_10g0009220 [Actinidia rufa]|uniref:Secreted protein n=1 Tax=Actinidia rufa TaxID=165716 RepID=A0A7J0FCC5_9ERIC|nr:hypothetical protein Acr_10g0009220 [Actinidia rufa]
MLGICILLVLNVNIVVPQQHHQWHGSHNHMGPFYPSSSTRLKTCTLMLRSLPRPGVGLGIPRVGASVRGITRDLWIVG